MPRSPYIIGRDAEYWVIRKLEAEGFKWIIRSAGSRGCIDLLASNGIEILAIQVKKRVYLNQREKRHFDEWSKVFKAQAILARKRNGRWVLEPALTLG